MRIQNNPMAINAYNNLQGTQQAQGKSLERLSSGFRINRAADDAAGLVISESLRSQVGGLKVAKRNAQDAVSLVQTAEGALTEVHSMLQRMRDLSVQSANDTNDPKGRSAIAAEMNQLKDQVKNVLTGTEFNGRKIFVNQGKTAALTGDNKTAASDALTDLSKGAKGSADNQLLTEEGNLPDGVAKALDSFTVSGATYNDRLENAAGHFAKLTGKSDLKAFADVGAANTAGVADGEFFLVASSTDASATFSLHLKSGAAASAEVTHVASRSDLETINEAKEGAQVALKALAEAPADNIKFQVGANNATTDSLSIVTSDVDLFTNVFNKLDASSLDVSNNLNARQSIDTIDELIGRVSEVRGTLGATQNRLDHTVNSIKVSVENLTASESRIRDTDMAEEMMSLTRSQILNQAGTAMLAQANQVPQGVLSLLR